MKYYHTKSKDSNVNVNKILKFSSPSVMLQQMLSRPLRDNHVFWGWQIDSETPWTQFSYRANIVLVSRSEQAKKMNVFIFVSTACYPFRQVTANVLCTIFSQITKQVSYVSQCEKPVMVKS